MLKIGNLYTLTGALWLRDEINDKYIPVTNDTIVIYIGIKKLKNGSERLHFLYDNRIVYYMTGIKNIDFDYKFKQVIDSE